MEKIVIAFAILVGLLILGIFILIKPHIFVFQSDEVRNAMDNQTSLKGIVPREIIILGAAFIMVGLIGLSVLGFRIYNELNIESNSKNS